MWGRIYPHVLLLIFANIIIKTSCKGNGSLTFLIDDTSSMTDDIAQVRSSVNQIMDIVFNEKASQIDNMVLVTFNDPDAEVRSVTKNRNDYKISLDAVYAHNIVNRDCWEPSMNGLLLALEKSHRDSYLYVFTDAPAKDYRDGHYVKEICQRKQSQIVFVLTGRCNDWYDAQAFDVYFDIADACGGLAFDVNKTEVKQVLETIKETIKGNSSVLHRATVPPNVYKDIPFTIDDQTDYAIVSVSGRNVYLNIQAPSATPETIMWNNNGKVIKLSNAKPGTYVATVKGETRTTVLIVGRTDFFFKHGFSELKPKSPGDTSPQPIADTNVHLSISVTDKHHSVKIISAQILKMDEQPMMELNLREISKDFYITMPFVAPSQMFKVAVIGTVKATGKSIKRIAKIPITPQAKPKKLPDNTKPTARIEEGRATEVEYNSSVKLTCKVKAYPEPKIKWINSQGVEMLSLSSTREYPYDYISYMEIANASKGDKYKCYAVNTVGKDSKTINVIVKDPFTVTSAPAGRTKVIYGSEGTITCDISSRLPMDIRWYYANMITGASKQIETSDKYWLSANHNQIKIKKMDMDLVGKYTCKAFLQNKKDVQKIFSTRIEIDGLSAPNVQGPADIKVIKGKTAVFECKITNGVPPPKITWLFGGKSGTKFTPIAGSENVLRVTNVEDKHAGKYKCVAENEVAKHEHITTLFVQESPKITSSISTVYRGTEGDDLLKIPCIATGAPKPTITWKINGRAISPNAKYSIVDGALRIRDPKMTDTNLYTCEAKNEVGSDSATFKTYIRQSPQVSGAAVNKVRMDTPANIECMIIKGEPKPKITWQYMDNHGSNFLPIAGTEKVLHIPKVENKHAGRYKCVAQNDVGSNEHVTILVVQEAPQVSGFASKKVLMGSSASIECTVIKGEPKPKLTWQYGDNSGSKFLPIAGTDTVLHISKVENKHAGRYKCLAQNDVGSNEHVTILVVQDPPKIMSNISTVYQSTEGEALLRIPCVAAGLPKPSIIWKLKGHAIIQNAKYTIADEALIIRDPKVTDTNSYTCEAKNEVGSDSATFKTYIHQAPQVSGVTSKKVLLGSSASIECTVIKGKPKPKLTWQYVGNSGSKFLPLAGTDEVLHISKVEDKHAGRYKCVAQNDVGSNEHVTILVVQDPPKIISNVSTVYQSTEGRALLRIPCVAAGLPKPSITWKLNGRAIIQNAKYNTADEALIIRDPKVTDTNSYTCEAKNEVGSDSATFKTYIRQAPQVSGVASKKVLMGSSASIECTILKGEPKPKLTWQYGDNSGSKFLPIAGTDTVLHISKVENKHAGRYKCVAQNDVGSNEHVTILVVQDPPKIMSNVSIVYQSTEGEALLKIPCVTAGLPKPSITWKLKGHTIIKNAKYTIADEALIIRDPKVTDTNSYTCEAKNEVGSDSATFKTYIRQAPQVSGVASKKVLMGSSDSIECTILKGEPKPKLTWQYVDNYGSKFLPIAGTDTVLHISKVENKHVGRYKCVAQNDVGSNEHVTILVVQDPPKIMSNVSIVYQSTEGEALLKIPCVTAGLPKPSISWKLKGHTIIKNAKYTIADEALIIRDPKVTDTNSYTCEAKNEVGSDSATFKTYIRQAPQVSGVASKKVLMGSSDSIECTILKGEPKPKLTWQYADNYGSKFLPIAGTDTVLHISKVENKHAGRYKCVAQNDVGSNEHVTILVVQDPPKIMSNVSTVYQSTEGEALLKIPCVAAGLPKPSITWKLKGHTIIKNAKYSIADEALIIRDPKVTDTNSYTCEAKNEVGSDSATFKTYIRQAPQVSGVASKKVLIGSSASIECTVIKGKPKPKLTWQYVGNSGSKFLPLAGTDEVLHISKVEDKHAGRYKCVAQNDVGSNEHVTILVVQDPPKIMSNVSTVYQSTEGEALLKIPCVATGLPKPSITWKLNGHEIIPSAKYSTADGELLIRDPKVTDTKSYTCEAKNEVGSDSASFKTYIRQAPQVSGVVSKKVRMGTSASIDCKIEKGVPKPKITWQFMDKSASKFVPIAGSENALRITSAENKHAGRYKCVGQNTVGSNEHVTTLIVESPPRIISNYTTVEGIEGDLALRIPCDVVGIPEPVITWKLNGASIKPDAKYSIENGALVIMDPKKEDSNKTYTCEAKNYIDSVSSTIQTIVKETLTRFGTKHYIYLLKGDTRKLECEAYKSKSQSVRWFFGFDEKKMKETYLLIEKASVVNDGNYTCRVSDKHGYIHTHTYVVDVGVKPELSEGISSVRNWQGDIKDIVSNCDYKTETKPPPDVQWKFNGKVLTDHDIAELGITYKWGHYSCNVSNVHGSVQRNFDVKSSACLITRNLRDAQYMPFALTDEGTWPNWETTQHYSVVQQEEKITLSCPSRKEMSNTFRIFPKQSQLKAICYKEDTFIIDSKYYKLPDLQCNKGIQASVIRKKVKCSTETSELIRVGYNVAGFLETYEVCFDYAKNMPLYTRALMTKTDGIVSAAYKWYTYPGIGDKKTEKAFTCKDTLSSCDCYGKSQLLNARDFNNGPAKNSTFIDPLNSVPAWRSCNTSKTTWEKINDLVRKQQLSYGEFVVWSGTHTLIEKHGAVIPRYLWKVLRIDAEQALAIVHVNDPAPTKEDIKCENICTDDDEAWFEVSDSYTYCCSLSEFVEKFDIREPSIGESLDDALEKMEKST